MVSRDTDLDFAYRCVEREAECLFKLKDPAIVRLLHVVLSSTADQRICGLVLGYIEGDLLSHYVRSNISVHERLQRTLELCKILQRLHTTEFFHRDLKPDNVMVRRKGKDKQLVVIDFGLAGGTSKPVPPFDHGSASAYLASEIIQSGKQHLTNKVDVFSFGVMIPEFMTGRRWEFRGWDLSAEMRSADILKSFPVFPPEWLWKPLSELTLTCVDSNPLVRPAFSSVATTITALLARVERHGAMFKEPLLVCFMPIFCFINIRFSDCQNTRVDHRGIGPD